MSPKGQAQRLGSLGHLDDGPDSRRTVVQIITDGMPFLVDSAAAQESRLLVCAGARRRGGQGDACRHRQ
ncbi:hypothetical protein [Actinomadura rubrobrunea]|uniref:hypothetical protein n=1 Tax=Actinomadura rubrobrunea TaxID=115335 RepID=UPI0036F341DE